ncbi:hypothetical protein ACF2JD_16800 [Aeromonas sp. A-5]|uniref:hypothetical protein n=1 Tax=Aeromonas ichthyocola TaxID=3367746 RepID=UPI0038DCEDF7
MAASTSPSRWTSRSPQTQPEQAAQAEQIVRLAHQTCPFSNAMRGDVVTRLLLNGAPLDETV